jgi:hypothetical protein
VENPAKPLRLYLTEDRSRQLRQTLAWTGLILAALVGAWILSYLPPVLAAFQKTWPEQILLAGWLVWRTASLADLAYVGLLFIGLGAGARLFLLGKWLVGLFHQAAASTPAGKSM